VEIVDYVADRFEQLYQLVNQRNASGKLRQRHGGLLSVLELVWDKKKPGHWAGRVVQIRPFGRVVGSDPAIGLGVWFRSGHRAGHVVQIRPSGWTRGSDPAIGPGTWFRSGHRAGWLVQIRPVGRAWGFPFNFGVGVEQKTRPLGRANQTDEQERLMIQAAALKRAHPDGQALDV
jgi:hypothetical protein